MRSWLVLFASLRLTFAAMVALGVVVLLTRVQPLLAAHWIVAPLLALALNLLAALATNRRMRSQPWLAMFHVALLGICVLAGANVLTRMHGRVEMVEGQWFSAEEVEIVERGAWHSWHLHEAAFAQGSIEVDFAPGMVRQRTRSQVWTGEGASPLELTDTGSLTRSGYRFVPTANKGHALIVTWRGETGGELAGAVHMPSYPAMEWKQERQWRTPAGEELRFVLKPAQRTSADAAWTLRGAASPGMVSVQFADREVALARGQWLALKGGSLRFEGARLWIGYRIDYQPLLPWMLATAVLGIAALSAHFLRNDWRDPARTARRGRHAWDEHGSMAGL